MDDRKNAPSASSFWRIVNCNGSHRASQLFGLNKDTSDSLKGDRVHGWLAAHFTGKPVEAESEVKNVTNVANPSTKPPGPLP